MRTTKKSILPILLVVLTLLFSNIVSADTGLEGGAVKLNMFLIISGLMVFFFLIGLFVDDSGFLFLVGCVLLFIMGFIIQAGNLYLPNGGELYEYGNNFTDYHWDNYTTDDFPTFTPADQKAYLFHTYGVFEPWDGNNSHLIGWLIMIVSVVLFALSLYNLSEGEY